MKRGTEQHFDGVIEALRSSIRTVALMTVENQLQTDGQTDLVDDTAEAEMVRCEKRDDAENERGCMRQQLRGEASNNDMKGLKDGRRDSLWNRSTGISHKIVTSLTFRSKPLTPTMKTTMSTMKMTRTKRTVKCEKDEKAKAKTRPHFLDRKKAVVDG